MTTRCPFGQASFRSKNLPLANRFRIRNRYVAAFRILSEASCAIRLGLFEKGKGRMPWMAVEKAYAFEGPQGKSSLLDLFEGRPQLIVYRAFFEPGVFGRREHACRGCSFGADQVAHLAHLNARDTTLIYASRAPPPTSASTSDTATTSSSTMATRCSAPTSSTLAATRPWALPGVISISPCSAARRLVELAR